MCGMTCVFVIDTEKRPLYPVHLGAARRLLTLGKAAMWRRYPFTIVLKRAKPDEAVEPLRLKIDPGSKTTGLAIVNDLTGQVPFAAELSHRSQQVRDKLTSRRALRHARRARHTRYRPAHYANRTRAEGWLAPSLQSRVQNVLTWVQRLTRLCPITALSLELVSFDTQLLQNPEISGVEYQQSELAGYEVREYLLEKWNRTCAYCGATGLPLQVEHIVPRSRGGSHRTSNLTLACERCNLAKGTQTAAEFGHSQIQARAKAPLKGAAAVNTTRWALYQRLRSFGLPLETGSGGRTNQRAHDRVTAWVGRYYPPHLQAKVVPCQRCGRPLPLRHERPNYLAPSPIGNDRGLHHWCPNCNRDCWESLDGLLLASPAGVAFTRRHPRMRTLPHYEVETEGRAAIVARFESVTEPERLALVAAADSFELLRVERADR